MTKSDDTEEKPVSKRESKFSILGIVQIHEFVVTVGFHVEHKKDQKEPEWIAVGSVDSIKLSELWSDLQGGFLDLELDNVALIASSEERKKNTASEEMSEGEKPESWDVLAQVDTFNYPIAKGMPASLQKKESFLLANRSRRPTVCDRSEVRCT